MKVTSAGIIAAGDGSRFKKLGINTHKPMIPVAGTPLIAHTLNNFKLAGINRVVIILNESERECVDWIKGSFVDFQLEFIVKSTESSYESFRLVGQKLGAGRHFISTVDSICSAVDLRKMTELNEPSPNGVYLGVTSFVDDEKPLWVEMDAATKRISALGGKTGSCITAGFYNVPDALFESKPETDITSLRVFLAWCLNNGFPVYGVPLSKVVDVDSPKDVEEAEKLLMTTNPNSIIQPLNPGKRG